VAWEHFVGATGPTLDSDGLDFHLLQFTLCSGKLVFYALRLHRELPFLSVMRQLETIFALVETVLQCGLRVAAAGGSTGDADQGKYITLGDTGAFRKIELCNNTGCRRKYGCQAL